MPAGSSGGVPVKRSAVFDKTRTYRYRLTRKFGPGKRVVFICLNPSKADEHVDDNTVRRCIGFAKKWEAGRLDVLNIFALRSTDPWVLYGVRDPVGPENDRWIRRTVRQADVVVAAWGNHGAYLDRGAHVRAMIPPFRVECFGVTKAGQPKHPLYLPVDSHVAPMV